MLEFLYKNHHRSFHRQKQNLIWKKHDLQDNVKEKLLISSTIISQRDIWTENWIKIENLGM